MQSGAPVVDAVLGDQGLVLLVEADRQIQALCREKGFLQDGCLHDGDAVIRKAYCAGGCKRIEIDSLLPLHTLRDICAAVEVDLFFFCTCQDIGENLRIVNDRICIGHQYDTCVSAARRSQ